MKPLLILLLAIPLSVYCQDKKDISQVKSLNKNFCDTIPFEYVRNQIIIEVEINNQKKRFLLCIGSFPFISDEIQAEMKNPIIKNEWVKDVFGEKQMTSIVSVKELKLGNQTFLNIPSAVINIKNTSYLRCFNFDGTIGGNLFLNCIVQIDIDKKQILLTDNIDRLELQNAYQTPMKLDFENRSIIELSLGDEIEFEAFFNSGNCDFITLSNKIFKKAFAKNIITFLNEGFESDGSNANDPASSNNEMRTNCSLLKLGPNEIINFIPKFSENSLNEIGMELADYGVITIDYINKNFYFEAKQKNQAYKYRKTLGFSFQPKSDYYSIYQVLSGTRAEQIGLKEGFQVLKLDDLDVSKRTPELDCQLFLTRPSTRNSKLKITYKDDNVQIKIAELFEE